jgi:hypothetical protein
MSTAPHPGALARRLAPVADLVALVKPTIMMMALLTAAGGFRSPAAHRSRASCGSSPAPR